MKTTWMLVLTAFAAMTAFASDTQTLKADIPFAFRAGQAVLPAGQYSVGSTANPHVVKLMNENGATVAMFTTNNTTKINGADSSVLVFNRYGNSSYLAKIWRAGDVIGREVYASKAEREARRAATSKIEVASVPLYR